MASNPNRSRDLLESNIMKIWIQPLLGACSVFQPLDEKAQNWLEANAPQHAHWYGHEFVLSQPDVEAFQNKFIDAGGQLS